MLRTVDQDTFFIPETKEEWEALKPWLVTHHKLEDTPETWTFVLSQLQGVKMPELTTTFSNIVAHYKRWKIAKVLQEEKIVYLQELQRKLEEIAAAEIKKDEGTSSQEEGTAAAGDLPGGTPCVESSMQTLPDITEKLVSETGKPGI